MEIRYTDSVFAVQSDGKALLMITIPKENNRLYDEIQAMENDKPKVITIKYYKEKRSLTANGYMFSLLSQIANKIGLSLGDCYVKHIKDYGVFVEGSYMTKKAFDVFEPSYSKASTKLEHSSSMCTVIREFQKNGIEWVEYIAFIGSSEYDKKQFSILLDGVVQEAKDIGIQTLDDLKIQELIERYEG